MESIAQIPSRGAISPSRTTIGTVEQPATLDPDATAVLFHYGATMVAAQNFERSLATLVVILGRSPRTRELKTPEAAARALQRALHAYRRVSAAELRRKLPEDFDPELLPELEVMIDWRDRLADRYLMEKLALDDCPGHFQPGTADELMEVGIGFQVVVAKLGEKITAAAAELPKGRGAADALGELIDGLARPVTLGEGWTSPAMDR